jgi:gluconolactonase
VATDAVAKPNGVVLSPDDKILYVADGNGMYLIAFDVQSDGSLTNKRNHARLVDGREGAYPKDPFGRQDETGLASVADGLAVDREGRIYVTSTPGVQVISPDGKHLGTIPTTHPLQNIAFAGKDMKSLYLFGNSNMYEVRTVVEGLRGRPK